MTPSSLPRILLVVVGVSALLAFGGCRPSFFKRDPKPAPPPAQTAPSPVPSADLGLEAEETVAAYLSALVEHKYADAYDLLSRESQSTHSRADFEEQGKREMPTYDLKSVKTISVTGETRALVEAKLLEDPASHGFTLVREDGMWKIVYLGGIPGWPEAE